MLFPAYYSLLFSTLKAVTGRESLSMPIVVYNSRLAGMGVRRGEEGYFLAWKKFNYMEHN